MNIGKLDRRLTLQQSAEVPQNQFGEEAPAGFADVATVAAGIEFKPGGEALQANQPTATQRVVFTIRYRPDVLPTWQLRYEGRIFQITDVAEIGRRRGLLLTCYAHG
jgi:SPP1 family predicted phage head-tail adaptor